MWRSSVGRWIVPAMRPVLRHVENVMPYQIFEDNRAINLTLEEAKTVIRGEIPPVLARSLAERGLELPRRGTRPLTLVIWHGESYLANPGYARIARAA